MTKLTIVACALFVATVQASAQTPDAKSLISKYQSAINADALLKAKSIKQTGTFEAPAMNISATVEVLRGAPNKLIAKSVTGMGEVIQGYDGRVGFRVDPMQGNKVLQGKELDELLEEALLTAYVRNIDHFTTMETLKKKKIDGQQCYEVKLVWKSGHEVHDCYAVDSGLLVATSTKIEVPRAGSVEVVKSFSDYKDFNGIKLPTLIVTSARGQVGGKISISTVAFDQLDDSAFALPESIRAMVGNK